MSTTSRINNGAVVPGDYSEVIAAGFLQPVKARRLLQILLALGKSVEEIQEAFEAKLSTCKPFP
jgi:L-asparaginase